MTITVTECLQATFYLLPPLLSIAELQISLPGPEAHWKSDYQQWQRLPPPQSPVPVCLALAKIGLQSAIPHDLDQSAQLTVLLSAFVQQTASQDLKRAMKLSSGGLNAMQLAFQSDPTSATSQTALDVLIRLASSQPLSLEGSATILSDFSILARICAILDYTPGRLLFPFSRWQTTDDGCSRARKELVDIVNHDIGRARYCLYHAAQLFRHFRSVKALRHIDTLALLLCTLYILLYIEVGTPQHIGSDQQAGSIECAKIIRLDQLHTDDELESWLSLRLHHQPHITGIGLLGEDRSSTRLYKEASRIMSCSASTSVLAEALAIMLSSQAKGHTPEFADNQ